MRKSTLTCFAFVAIGFAASAQKFTLLPMAGLENPLTKLSYNNLPSLKPLQSKLAPTLGLRIDYNLKSGHGPFAGIVATRPSVSYSFANPETGMNVYTASRGNYQLQLQGGWQVSTKPIYFKKSTAAKTTAQQTVKTVYSRCGSYKVSSHCSSGNRQPFKASQNNSWFMRVMPSAGIALNPFAERGVTSKVQGGSNTFTYNAGNFKTALLTGVAFEFGSGAKRHFTMNVNYVKSLDENRASFTTQAGPKMVTTNLSSKVSAWNASIGIPISFAKKSVVKQVENKIEIRVQKKKCEFWQYKPSCSREI